MAGGTIIPELGMVVADERGSGAGTTPLPAQPLQLAEVLQEGQDSLSDSPLLSGADWESGTEAQHRLAGMWGIRSTSGENNSLFFCFLITCGQSLLALPPAKQLSLPCPSWLCAAPLPW